MYGWEATRCSSIGSWGVSFDPLVSFISFCVLGNGVHGVQVLCTQSGTVATLSTR